MSQAQTAKKLSGRSVLVLVLALLFGSACGLGMDTAARLERGDEAFVNGEYRAAIIDAKYVLSDEPENAAARLLLGRASVAVGDAVAAEKELRRAVELGTLPGAVVVDLGRALLLQRKYDETLLEIGADIATSEDDRLAAMRIRGEAHLELGQAVEAREIFTQVLASDVEDVSAQLGIVKSYVAERNYLQARETLDSVLALDDSHIPSWLTSGSLGLLLRDTKKSANDYSRAMRLAREVGDDRAEMIALSGLFDALLAQDNNDEARKASVRMAEIAPDDLRTHLVSARLAAIDSDWAKAQGLLQQILRRAPDYRQAQMLLGYVHKESGNLGQAEMYLTSALAAAPGDPNARRLLAETRLALNKADEARQILGPLLAGQETDIGSLSLAAVASLDLGEYAAATELLERGVAKDPSNIDLQIQLAFAYLRSEEQSKAQQMLEALPANIDGGNEFRRDSLLILAQLARESQSAALELATKLAARWPSRPEAHYLLGIVAMSSGDNVAARGSFEAASELVPDDIQAIHYLARLDELDGDAGSAVDRYQLILKLAPGDTQALIALARQSVRSEDYVKGRQWLEKAAISNSRAVAPRELLAKLLLALREFSAAELAASEALDLAPKDAALLSLLGRAQLYQGKAQTAVTNFRKAVDLAPEEASFRANLANAQATSGEKTSALATLEEEATQSLRHIPSAVLLASLKADAGDLDGAEEIARRLRQAHPDRAEPFALTAELKLRGGKLIAASDAYDTALSLENLPQLALRAYQIRSRAGLDDQVGPLVKYLEKRPFDSTMRIYLAQAFQDLGKIGDANAQYERVLRDEPDNFVSANNLAWNYFKSGNPQAESIARQAYSIQPENTAVNDTLGWILVNNGDVDEGITILRRAVGLGEGRPEIRYHLAAGLVASGDTSEAERILRDILSRDNNFNSRQQAQELLSKL